MLNLNVSRRFAVACALMGSLSLGACATMPAGVGGTSSFNSDDFSWSAQPGTGVIKGRVVFSQDGKTFTCAGNVGLIPDTRYTRARMERLYGSTTRAAVPVAVVRARSTGEQGAEYRAFERAEACTDNSFRFSNLPDGRWFLISPVRSDDAVMVLMRQVQTRGGHEVPVTLGN